MILYKSEIGKELFAWRVREASSNSGFEAFLNLLPEATVEMMPPEPGFSWAMKFEYDYQGRRRTSVVQANEGGYLVTDLSRVWGQKEIDVSEWVEVSEVVDIPTERLKRKMGADPSMTEVTPEEVLRHALIELEEHGYSRVTVVFADEGEWPVVHCAGVNTTTVIGDLTEAKFKIMRTSED